MSFKVIDVDTNKKLVTIACYDTQDVSAYLQPFSRYTSHFLRGQPYLTLACTGLLEPRKSRLRLLKSTFSAENFIRRLPWSISSHFVAVQC